MWMVHGRDLGVTRGAGQVLGLWILETVSEMEPHQFEQCFNLTDLLGSIGLNDRYPIFVLLLIELCKLNFPGPSPELLSGMENVWYLMQLKLDFVSLHLLLTSFDLP